MSLMRIVQVQNKIYTSRILYNAFKFCAIYAKGKSSSIVIICKCMLEKIILRKLENKKFSCTRIKTNLVRISSSRRWGRIDRGSPSPSYIIYQDKYIHTYVYIYNNNNNLIHIYAHVYVYIYIYIHFFFIIYIYIIYLIYLYIYIFSILDLLYPLFA